eukprot:GHVR01044506.1.p1 GENE.GHVR01044506.1~~GHVR01044506.1.p1  ORF type:complete len:146 (+),score=14.69 GHVR01044506.1:42-479(+)
MIGRSNRRPSSSLWCPLSRPTHSTCYLSSLAPLLTSYLDVIKLIIKADIYDFNKEDESRLADSCDKLDASERKLIETEKKLVATEENLQGTWMLYKDENEKQERMEMKHKEYEDKLTPTGKEYTARNIRNVINACVLMCFFVLSV